MNGCSKLSMSRRCADRHLCHHQWNRAREIIPSYKKDLAQTMSDASGCNGHSVFISSKIDEIEKNVDRRNQWKILHVDMDAFRIPVEQRTIWWRSCDCRRKLTKKGVVSTCSYEAKLACVLRCHSQNHETMSTSHTHAWAISVI